MYFISCFFFFFNDTATTEIYTLSLHDALPISFGFSVSAVDNARNISQIHVTYTIVDRRPPRINVQSPRPDHDYAEGSTDSAWYECLSPGGFHIVSCTGTVPHGAPIDTSSIGPRTFTVTATDENGK